MKTEAYLCKLELAVFVRPFIRRKKGLGNNLQSDLVQGLRNLGKDCSMHLREKTVPLVCRNCQRAQY